MRRLQRVVLAGALAVAVAACGGPDSGAEEEVRAAIARTERGPRGFVFEEQPLDGSQVEVRGVIEDDFRYKARVLRDGAPAADYVVSDDAVAVRFLDQTAADAAAARAGSPEVADALRARRWVLDPAGAPDVTALEREETGTDPVLGALTTLRYVERVFREMRVREFNENALDYRPREDTFPKPKRGSPVERFDVERAPVPRPTDAGGANQAVPGPASFRKMSVYVQDGRVVRVLEDMDVVGRLDDLQRNYGIKLDDGRSAREAARIAIDAINAVRKGQGQDPVRVRKMAFEVVDPGRDVSVDLPVGDVVEGSLAFLFGGDDARAAA